jgi:AraC-like DNA-binding protein
MNGNAVRENTKSVHTMSTELAMPSERFGVWRDMLNATHLEWNLIGSEPEFNAHTIQRRLDDLMLVECYCDPCHGVRGSAKASATDNDSIAILFELAGREFLRQGDDHVTLTPGDFVVWDSAAAVEFRVLEPLHKFTIFLPKTYVELKTPFLKQAAGYCLGHSSALGSLIAGYTQQLSTYLTSFDDTTLRTVTDALLELVAAEMHQVLGESATSNPVFENILEFIRNNLPDPELSPKIIADTHGMSLRTLHKLFAEQGCSVSRRIRRLRLHECRKALTTPVDRRSITQIAYDWGFSDSAHFSRLFSLEFGESPRQTRQKQLE